MDAEGEEGEEGEEGGGEEETMMEIEWKKRRRCLWGLEKYICSWVLLGCW